MTERLLREAARVHGDTRLHREAEPATLRHVMTKCTWRGRRDAAAEVVQAVHTLQAKPRKGVWEISGPARLALGAMQVAGARDDAGWAELELLMASADASALNALDYGAVVLLCTALAYPVTRWIEPRVAAWLRARVEGATSRAQMTSVVVQL